MDALTSSLAGAVRSRRESRGWSVAALAERAGVSRAMIAKIERGDAAPTAVLLGKLSGALGLTLSELVASAELAAHATGRLARADDQPTWTDPVSGYRRRALSPRTGGPVELVEVVMPAEARASFPAETYTFIHQQIWVLEGTLDFTEGSVTHELRAGDCLELGDPAPGEFHNRGAAPCRYLVAVARR